eukprot:TCALIF_07731-PA protein Name:"Similar to AMPP Probable Xaa-Pro aminopeptidase P (Tuber melanosporum (strain Mel28))" AED:0.31 eAED:0.31 QI:0/0.83/0.71/1/1/1/7/0/582
MKYFVQARHELDCQWLSMKGDEGGDKGILEWLDEQLPSGSKVGADSSLTGAWTWLTWKAELEHFQLELVPTLNNPLDKIWTDQPERNQDPLMVLDSRFTGQTWADKLQMIRDDLRIEGHDAFIVTALDEIAWLFNLRGKDIPYNPVFRAYAMISDKEVILYLPPEKQDQIIRDHLSAPGVHVQIKDYELIFVELPTLAQEWSSILLGKKWAYSGGGSYAIYSLIPSSKLSLDLSPIMLRKAQKNDVERQGMINANRRDAVAVIEFAAHLEETMAQGEAWDELKASEELLKRREALKFSQGPSFSSISAYGPHGAIIHYRPDNESNAPIGTDSLYLLDSGGQYLDGTTDTTRTFHFGSPTAYEKEMYTRVLQGAIDLARAVFPHGTPDTRVDILARRPLLEVGLNYRHGTGHGIGAFGFIHESPIQVRMYGKEEHVFEVGQFFSDEPGYYEAQQFGIRLETVLRVVERPILKYNELDDHGPMLGFEPVCLVPFEPKLIIYDMLNEAQTYWLNRYNRLIREKIGPLLEDNSKAYHWMWDRTELIGVPESVGNTESPDNAQNGSKGFRPVNGILAIALVVIWFQV